MPYKLSKVKGGEKKTWIPGEIYAVVYDWAADNAPDLARNEIEVNVRRDSQGCVAVRLASHLESTMVTKLSYFPLYAWNQWMDPKSVIRAVLDDNLDALIAAIKNHVSRE
jgi:hypothetical protein